MARAVHFETRVAQRGRQSNPPFPAHPGTSDGHPASGSPQPGGFAAPPSTLLADLLQRLEDYYRYRDANDVAGQARFAELSAWFEGRNTGQSGGFEFICGLVQLDPEFIRGMIRNRTETRDGG